MTPKLTAIPDTFLTELERLSPDERQALSPAFQDFLVRRAALDASPQATLEDLSYHPTRPSMVHAVAKGVSYWTSVDLVDVDTYGVTIRAALEHFEVKVNRFPVGRAQHIVNVLSGEESTAPFIIISSHGDEGRIVLPSLGPQVAATERFNDYLTPQDLHTFVNLPGRVVISLGCATGTEDMARAFLDHGCSAYIAPEDYPRGYTSIFVPTFLFYELTEKRSLQEAVARLREHDRELAMWRLFE